MKPWSETFVCPRGWRVLEPWGDGFACKQLSGGLRVLIDCEEKADGAEWIHVSVSRKDWTPSHADMATVKQAFIGNQYAYSVWPPQEVYVNIHAHCLHIWARRDGKAMLPEFSDVLPLVGRSI